MKPCSGKQLQDVDSILGQLHAIDRTPYFVNDHNYLEIIRQQGKVIYNGRTYVMDEVKFEPEMKINASLGYYYDAMTTCDAFEWELLNALGETVIPTGDFASLRKGLRLRNLYHEKVPDPTVSGTGRSAMISTSTLIAFNDGKTYRAFIRTRSRLTASRSNLYRLVPSFIFQPTIGDLKNEYSVRHNIYREYLEEIFG